MKLYVWVCSLLVAFSGFMWGYEVGSINGVKEMPGYRKILNLPQENGTCTSSSDDVETGALLGIIVTVLHVGCFIGALFSGVLSDVAGRKAALVTGAVCCVVGSVLQSGAVNIWMVFPGRIISGLGIGILYQVAPLYIAESTPKHLRGRVVSCMGILTVTGVLLGNIVNTFIVKFLPSHDWGWRISLAIHGLAATVLGVGGAIVPESPRWLSKKQRYSKALVVLKRIHEDDSRAVSDLEEIKQSIKDASTMKLGDTIRFMLHWNVMKRVLLGFFLQLNVRFAGGPFIVYYSVTLFCQIGVDGFIGTVALMATSLGCQFLNIALIDKAGRKPLLLFGGVGILVCLIIAATLIHVFNLETNTDEDLVETSKIAAAYMVVILVILFASIYNMSFGIVPFLLNSEIFPLQIRGITVAISTTGWWGGTIIVAQLSSVILSSSLGAFGIFFLIAGMNTVLIVYVLLLIPETKGKSLEEIELLFHKPWYKRANILYYVSCFCLLPQSCKEKCHHSLQRTLSLKVVSSVDAEDSEQLLNLTSSDGIDSSLLADNENDSCVLNGSSSVQGSETASETVL